MQVARGGAVVGAVVCVAMTMTTSQASAEAPVGLGTASNYGVLGGAGVTNTGPSVIGGDLGTCPSLSVTGFPPGVVLGVIHSGDTEACSAETAATTAYDDAAGRAPNTVYPGPQDLGGLTLVPGVYKDASSMAITGTLTLDGQGNPDAVFIFQMGSTLITASNSKVELVNGADSCNVFWQVGSSATLGVGSEFAGTVLALTSITANTGSDVQGALFARNGATTLDSATITTACAASAIPTTTTSTSATALPGVTTTVDPTSPTTIGGLPTTSSLPTVTTPPASAALSGPVPAAATVSVSLTPGTSTTSGRSSALPRTGVAADAQSMFGAALLMTGVVLRLCSRSAHLH